MRFEDPEAGWRKIPDMTRPEEGKVQVGSAAVFHVDTEASTVTLQEGGARMPVGPKMVYMMS